MQNILITGASRGIGLGLAQAYLDRGAHVHAVVRNADSPALRQLQQTYPDRLHLIACDLNHDDAAAQITQALNGHPLDIAIFNAGIMGPSHQDVAQASASEIAELFLCNAIAPLRLARQLAAQVIEGGVLAFMSSQMGSVQLARASDMPLYGASKAALNSLLRSWSEAEDRPAASLLALHPGWVRTDMGGSAADLDVATSAAGLVATIASQLGTRNCLFLDYQQQPLAW
ncbi:SDR family oxidoreductase [Pseudomonas sp. GOM6]|uniref:SDR family oxidoreductase n=1 Tax=Pseudomonas sp. GOM6 TaxID=3036944 RepID=UPI0024098C19|nr:SDR family oxidoreductase [Pseudomonas sp. GOM6]MDG1580189.1 SDR family oxidoreductase [Pseudomonas sp. GOM6]